MPSGFYSSRISSKRGWIYSVIDPNGDIDGNGISNLLDYAALVERPCAGRPRLADSRKGRQLARDDLPPSHPRQRADSTPSSNRKPEDLGDRHSDARLRQQRGRCRDRKGAGADHRRADVPSRQGHTAVRS